MAASVQPQPFRQHKRQFSILFEGWITASPPPPPPPPPSEYPPQPHHNPPPNLAILQTPPTVTQSLHVFSSTVHGIDQRVREFIVLVYLVYHIWEIILFPPLITFLLLFLNLKYIFRINTFCSHFKSLLRYQR